MNDKNQKKGMDVEIQKVDDCIDQDIEAHIGPLLDQVSNLKLEKIDLTTKESAAAAIPILNDTLEQLASLRNVTRTLKTIIKDK